jgi:ribose transport system substrate-binding protein
MKNNRTVIAIVIVAAIAVAAFFACRRYSNTPSTSENKKTRIAFVVPVLDNPFFVDMTNAATAKAKQMQNVEVIVKASTSVQDAIGQNQIVDDLITQKVDAICLVPTSSESIIPAIQKANSAGIPVINIDNKIDAEKAAAAGAVVSTYIGSDNFEGGKLAGQYMVERLGGKGKVAILEGVSGNDAAIKRKAGFLDALKGSPGIEVVASQVANWNREQAFNIFQNILKANPDLNGVFACNDEMVLGASAALEQSKISKSKIVVVGFDAIKEAVDAVNAGKIDATVAQQPVVMGERALGLTLDILAKKNVEKSYSTELKIVTKGS